MAQYKRISQFKIPPTLAGKSADEMGKIVEKHLRDIAAQLNSELTNLERSSAGSSNITVINGSATTSGSSGGGGGSSTNFRAGSAAIVSAGTVVAFSSPMAGGYVLVVRAFNSSNQTIGADITAADANGFTITPVENGTVQYAALPYA